MKVWGRWILLGLILGLSACGSLTERQDSAPRHAPDVSSVPDAVPRIEPKSKYGNPVSYVVQGKRYYVMRSSAGYHERGIASWYGTKFHGKRTSSGERYDMYAMTAAHKTLPLPSYVRVTNLDNGRSVVVRVNDRGPFHENRLIDLSYSAAKRLGMIGHGTALVDVQAVSPGEQYQPVSTSSMHAITSHSAKVYLQVGAFSTLYSARQLKQKIQRQIGQAIIIMPLRKPEQTLYRVRIGPLKNVEQGDALATQLSVLGYQDAHMVVE